MPLQDPAGREPADHLVPDAGRLPLDVASAALIVASLTRMAEIAGFDDNYLHRRAARPEARDRHPLVVSLAGRPRLTSGAPDRSSMPVRHPAVSPRAEGTVAQGDALAFGSMRHASADDVRVTTRTITRRSSSDDRRGRCAGSPLSPSGSSRSRRCCSACRRDRAASPLRHPPPHRRNPRHP